MNNYISKYLTNFIIKISRKHNVLNQIKQLDGIQYKSIQEIYKLRDDKLSVLINYAYSHILYYKSLFDDLNVNSHEISNVFDLKKIPTLSKKQIIKDFDNLINHSFKEKISMRNTGGSTGISLHFAKDVKALCLNDAIMYRCYKWYGIDMGDRQVRFWGVPLSGVKKYIELLKDFLLNRIRISAFEISKESSLKQYIKIKHFKPSYFYGYTTAIYGFCRFLKENNLDFKGLNLKALICTSEKMYPHHLKLFHEMFDCPVVDEYGSSENGIIAFQCKNGNMHIMADHLCVEFIGDDNMPVANGELGKIVITDLSSQAMPLIRYEIGDMGRPSGKKCACGINLPIMEIVEGRNDDFIIGQDGRLVHSGFMGYSLKDEVVYEYRMIQKSKTVFHVQIVKSPIFSDDSEQKLARKLRKVIGDDIQISFEYLEQIPREPSGKLRYFISEIEKT